MARTARNALCLLVFGALTGCTFSFDTEAHCYVGEECGGTDAAPPADVAPDTAPPVDTDSEEPDAGPEADTPPGDDDPDKDGLKGAADNCPEVWNPNRLDYDDDGLGDECDSCPFLEGNDAGETDCYPEGFKRPQLSGEWRSFFASTRGTDEMIQLGALDLDFTENTYAVGDGSPTLFELGDDGLVFLPGYLVVPVETDAGTSEVRYDVMATVDESRELAVGQLFLSEGQPPVSGLAIGPNMFIMLRKRRFGAGMTPLDILSESTFPPNKPAERQWYLYGWTQTQTELVDEEPRGPLLTIQSTFRTQVTYEDDQPHQLSVVPYDSESGVGAGYVFAGTKLLNHSIIPSNQKPTITMQAGGGAWETSEGFAMTMNTKFFDGTESPFALLGALSFSREIAILFASGESDDPIHPGQTKQVRAVMLLTERHLEPAAGTAADPRLRQYALHGVSRDVSMRGLIAETPAKDAPVALQFHYLPGLSTAHQSPIFKVAHEPAFLSLDDPETYTTQTDAGIELLQKPRVCIRPTESGHVGLAVVCPHIGLIPEKGCPLEKPCWVSLGMAVRTQGIAPSDVDLDGKASGAEPYLGGCQGVEPDTCPCRINPDFDDC